MFEFRQQIIWGIPSLNAISPLHPPALCILGSLHEQEADTFSVNFRDGGEDILVSISFRNSINLACSSVDGLMIGVIQASR